MPQQNTITVAGDGNITIQDVHGSTIHLNANDPAILNQLEALQKENATAFQSLMETLERQHQVIYQRLTQIAPKLPKDLTLHIPKMHPADVVGREAELLELHELLFDNKRVVVVNGLGGIGKTTLAQVYVGQYYEAYRHIVWISQLSENIVNDVINAEGLTEQLAINTEGKDPQAIFYEIISKLKSITDQPNLLILDNADATLTQLYDLLPTQPDWHVLVTSREQIERFYTKTLDFLSPQKALALFQKHCTRITDEAAIQTILKTIDYHTLTIEILAKTAQKQRTPLAELQTAIEIDLKANVYVPHKGDKIDKVRSYLAAIFDFNHTTTDEQWLLKQMVCLPSEYHPYAILEELINPAASERTNIFSETLEELAAKGWLLHNPDTDSYKMHRIIAEVASQKLPPTLTEVVPLIEMVTEKLRLDETKNNPVDKFPWVSFGKAILVHFSTNTENQIAILQNNLGTVLQALGDYGEAKNLLEKAIVSIEKNYGAEHPEIAIFYSNLATVLKALSDYQGAKILMEKVVTSAEKNYGKKHPTMAVMYSNLALILETLGDYSNAKNFLDKAVVSAEQNFGEMHPLTTQIYSNLAAMLKILGDYWNAKSLMEKLVASMEKNYGGEHPTTAVMYSNLAMLLQDLKDYENAKSLLEKAVTSAEKNYGEEHPQTILYYSNLALVLQDLGYYKKAKSLMEKVVTSAKKNYSESHPQTALYYSNLAMILQALEDYTAAIPLLEKAYTIYKNHLGEQHPTTKIIKENLDAVLQASKPKSNWFSKLFKFR